MREALRPLIFEEVRLEVDEELRLLLENLKAMVEAEKAARTGKKSKGAKKSKKGKKNKDKGAKGKKLRKDPTADVSIEYLYAELVQNDIIRMTPPEHTLSKFIASSDVAPSARSKPGDQMAPTVASARAAAVAYGVIPLGSMAIHTQLPLIKKLLLYGPPGCGKTHLAHAIATASGANFLDISPRNTDGKFPKQAAMMMHKVFKVARVMAPSVVHMDQAETVFISDKKKCGGGAEPYNRIRKDLGKELDALEHGDRVLLVATTSAPHVCVKKDELGFCNFWDRAIHVPEPVYGDRLCLWPALAARFGGSFPAHMPLSGLAHISEGQTTLNLAKIMRRILTPRRLETLDVRPITEGELVARLSSYSGLHPEESDEPDITDVLRNWEKLLPGFREKFGAKQAVEGAEATGGKDAKGKKKKG